MTDAGASAIRPAGVADVEAVRGLFREYAESLDFSLCFQGFDEELASLPGPYAPPRGRLLLAESADGEPLGCVALRDLGDGACEMRRLFVRPAARGTGLGRRLAQRVIEEARAGGWRRVRLHTLGRMVEARGLYPTLGFREVPADEPVPVEGAIFFERDLAGEAGGIGMPAR